MIFLNSQLNEKNCCMLYIKTVVILKRILCRRYSIPYWEEKKNLFTTVQESNSIHETAVNPGYQGGEGGGCHSLWSLKPLVEFMSLVFTHTQGDRYSWIVQVGIWTSYMPSSNSWQSRYLSGVVQDTQSLTAKTLYTVYKVFAHRQRVLLQSTFQFNVQACKFCCFMFV